MLVGVQKLNQVSPDVLQASYGDDTNLYVEFVWEAVKNEHKSMEAGRPIFEDKEYVRIIAPGDKTKSWFRPVRKVSNGTAPADIDRWPKQWAAFQNQQKQHQEGTPLEECAFLTRSDVANLKADNVHTLEQLASIPDVNLSRMGSRGMRDKAKLMIEKAKEAAPDLKLQKMNEDLQNQIDALKNQLQGFQNSGIMLPEKVQTSPRKRGPKSKVKDEQNIPRTDAGGG